MSWLLNTDPIKRPSVPELMSHHWLAPYIFRIPTTVGMIPCTSRPPRPLSLGLPDEPDPNPPNARYSAMSTLLCPPSTSSAVYTWVAGVSSPLALPLPPSNQHLTQLSSVCISSQLVAGVESSGQVVLWEEGKPRHLSGVSGITIVKVALGR